jgi:hypothetical protein
MSQITVSPTILADVLLAGHTLVTKDDTGWIAQEITATGRLGSWRPLGRDPGQQGWRAAPSR